MDKNCTNKCNNCNASSCKELQSSKSCKKVYCSGKMDSTSCPMFVLPVSCEDFQIYNILSCRLGKIVGLKLEGSDCILKLKIIQVNQCAIMGKTPSGKGPIYIKLSSIQYVDLGKEVYVNPLCSTTSSMGIPGPKGDKGDMGPAGPKGDKGDMGPAGPKGDKGDMGPAGSKGDKGDMGPAGSKGDKGDMGSVGSKGDKGDMGPAGPKGNTGSSGVVVPPTISDKEYKNIISDKEYKKKKYNSK